MSVADFEDLEYMELQVKLKIKPWQLLCLETDMVIAITNYIC